MTKVTKLCSYYNKNVDYDSYIIERLGKDLLPKYIRLAISVLFISTIVFITSPNEDIPYFKNDLHENEEKHLTQYSMC